jgi:hypothetical protein
MKHRFLISIGILVMAIAVAQSPAAAQAPSTVVSKKAASGTASKAAAAKSAVPRTPWGEPDLQGVWNDATSTPLQRPTSVGGKDVLNDEEEAEFANELEHNLTRDRRDGPASVDVNRAYNEHWMDARRLKVTEDHRTSLIVDPPDGRIPALVPLSPERAEVKKARSYANGRFLAGLPDNVFDFSLPLRCILRTDSPPYLPTIYNNDFQIVQSPGMVVIAPEMIHSARIIPTDGRPHLPSDLHQWLGDSRGHWEGDTLVVDTTNFRSDEGVIFGNANPATYKITERFTRVDANTLNYEFTVQDPTTWVRPWTARIPWTKIDPGEQMYEYACHEDNYDLVHFLSGARQREREGKTGPPPKPADRIFDN